MDFIISNHGTVVLLIAITQQARDWADAHLQLEEWQEGHRTIAVEPRYISDIARGIVDEGLSIGGAI
jgi:hypothetical protein